MPHCQWAFADAHDSGDRMRGRIECSATSRLSARVLVSIDLGQEDGVVPGDIFTIFRYRHDGARKVLGTLAVLTVQRGMTAKIMESKDYILTGDLIELK
jgi:hypothetical protein